MFFRKLGFSVLAVLLMCSAALAVDDTAVLEDGTVVTGLNEAELSGFGTVIRNAEGKGEILHGLDPELPLGKRVIEMDYPPQQLGSYAAGSFWATCFGLASEYRRPFHQIVQLPDPSTGKFNRLKMTVSQAHYIAADDRYVMEYSTVLMPREWTSAQAKYFTDVYRKLFEQTYCKDMTLVAVTADRQQAWTGFTLVCQDHRGWVAIMNVKGRLIEYIFVADPKLAEWLSHPEPRVPIEPVTDEGLGLLLLPKEE